MPPSGLSAAELNFDSLSDPSDRYELLELLGSGVCADVYVAIDNQAGGKRVAIKIQKLSSEVIEDVQEEYRILRDLSSHQSLPDFYGAYLKKGKSGKPDELWFVMQLCEGGPVTDLVRALLKQNKKLTEEYIAYILREVVKGLVYLHENHVIHRDVRGSNILLTKEGEIKIVDFGLSRELKSSMGKRNTCLGSPCWMAPEVITSTKKDSTEVTEYDNRADVWALGITAIELGDGKPPFQDMHPTRILFQIVRNPPPTLYRPANWTQIYNDFITECLEKNPENRPFMIELLEHPFFTALPENDFHLGQELKMLLNNVTPDIISTRKEEVRVKTGYMKTKQDESPEPLHVEDLAAIEEITEDSIVNELFERHVNGYHYSFIGDVLLFLNPNEELDIYGPEMNVKYHCKSRSDNAPHIYTVADSAYQDVLHHEEPQHILLAGETLSGKTTLFKHLVKHLSYLGLSPNKVGERVEKAVNVIHAFGNAATSLHNDSTRHVLEMQMTYSTTGKLSGAIFWLYQLEKWRVTGYKCPSNANFHIFYYMYDAFEAQRKLEKYNLEGGRNYNYLRITGTQSEDHKALPGPRENPSGNVKKFKEIEEYLTALEFDDDQRDVIWRTLSFILLLGEVEFQQQEDGKAEIKNTDIANKAAQLVQVDEKKFCWSLCNYCVVQKGTAVRRRHTTTEAEEAKQVLARGTYCRLVDWIVNIINLKLSLSRAVFGDRFYISLLDIFGFECYQKNGMEQLFVNTLNEQLQYLYNQRVFVWEMQEQEEEMIPLQPLQFYDNKPTVDELMNKPDGLLYLLDEANKSGLGGDFIVEKLQTSKGTRVKMSNSKDFAVAHYTGKVVYNTYDISTKNHDFFPPEMIETMRVSTDPVVKLLFTNQLSRSGNLTMPSQQNQAISVGGGKRKRWGAALVAEKSRARKYNTESRGEFSQTRKMRTAAAVFRASSLELIRYLTCPDEGSTKLGGVHFVRCIRADLTGQPRGFQPEVVRQQLRALAVIDTARARQKGYSHRISFGEFIRRYQFLAFDFDETVDITKDNCRLLLVRLKMEGWVIGRTKVFLKYYNEEYLARLYEVQVKKIIKVQTMLRAFLAKRNVAVKKEKVRQDSIKEGRLSKEASLSRQDSVQNAVIKVNKQRGDTKPKKEQQKQKTTKDDLSEENAALVIQSQFRGYQARKQYGPKLSSGKLDTETALMMKQFCKKWKAKSIFQVLLLYRAARHQDLVYFSQQVHLFNQNAVSAMTLCNKEVVSLNNINTEVRASKFLGKMKKPVVWKLPFKLNDFLPFCDSSHLCNTLGKRTLTKDEAPWDDPFVRRSHIYSAHQPRKDDWSYTSNYNNRVDPRSNDHESDFIQTPYCRDPDSLEEVYRGQQFQKADQYDSYKQRNGSRKKSRAPATPQRNLQGNTSKDKYFNEHWEHSEYDNISISSRQSPAPGKQDYGYNNSSSSNCNSPAPNYQPPPPNANFINQPKQFSYNVNDNNNREKQLYTAHSNEAPKKNGNPNPIREMQMLGRQNNNFNDDNDEPPFNFQAMLRKTNNNRASLKRSTTYEPNVTSTSSFQTISEQPTYDQTRHYNKNKVNSNKGYNDSVIRSGNVVYNSNNNNTPSQLLRQGSAENRKMLVKQHKMSAKQNTRKEHITTEIAPGIIVEGEVAEL